MTSDAIEYATVALLERRGFRYATDPMEYGQDAFDLTNEAREEVRCILSAVAELPRIPTAGQECDLPPCPWCQQAPDLLCVNKQAGLWWLTCGNPACSIGPGTNVDSKAAVIAAWTTRKPSPQSIYEGLAHGDDTHRAWLKEAVDALFAGRPVPPPRAAAPSSMADGGRTG